MHPITRLLSGAAAITMGTIAAGCGTPPKPSPTATPKPTPAPIIAIQPNCHLPWSGSAVQGGLDGVADVTGVTGETFDANAVVAAYLAGASTPTQQIVADPEGNFTFSLPAGLYYVGIVSPTGKTTLIAAQVTATCTTNIVLSINFAGATPTPSPSASVGASGSVTPSTSTPTTPTTSATPR